MIARKPDGNFFLIDCEREEKVTNRPWGDVAGIDGPPERGWGWRTGMISLEDDGCGLHLLARIRAR